jgi:hypothetical protein
MSISLPDLFGKDRPPLTEEEKKQNECLNCLPVFDLEEVIRLKMGSSEIRKKYPRWFGTCQTCGYCGVKYACYEQYIYGDY